MDRNIWCVLGLPFDAISMVDVIENVNSSAKNNTPCFISTPNLNFLIASQKDSAFRNSVINSDFSIPDGKPIVWVARILGVPIRERVAGSDLIEALIDNKSDYKPLKTFFFGGQPGVAEIACNKLNLDAHGLKCVGSLNPGFGSIEEISSDVIISTINQSNADFIIVSLGAKKGQAWIERNRNNINAPVISHLGAVVNFIAGTVKRSPKIFQKFGLEWVWRIKEEPLLWRRYFYDAMSFAYLLVTRVIPLFVLTKYADNRKHNETPEIIISSDNDPIEVVLSGCFSSRDILNINESFKKIIKSSGNVEITIKNGSYIDASFIAKLMLLKIIVTRNGRGIVITSRSRLVANIFRYNCCEYLLQN